MSPAVPVTTERCGDLGQHEVVFGAGPQCDGGTEHAPCRCWCHGRARTDRRLLERADDARCGTKDAAAVLELAGHLRQAGGLAERDAEIVVGLVLDLGWRRVLGWAVDPARRVPDPLVVPASTVRALDSAVDHEADGALEDLLSRLAEAEGRRARPARAARHVEEVPGV